MNENVPARASGLRAGALALTCLLGLGGCAGTPKSTDADKSVSADKPVSAADARAMQVVVATIHERFPDLKIVDAHPSPLPGFYEVFTGTQLLYSNATGDYIFVGKLVESRTKRNLAEEKMQERLTIDFDKLPFDQAITIVKGDGKRKLALFEDPDCPFCQRLEQELTHVDNVTVYVFLLPFTQLHPQARVHAQAIWCAPDKAAAWTQWMLQRVKPAAAEGCSADPLDSIQAYSNDINVAATPTFFLQSGRRIQGTVSAAQLEELMDTGKLSVDEDVPVAAEQPAPPPHS